MKPKHSSYPLLLGIGLFLFTTYFDIWQKMNVLGQIFFSIVLVVLVFQPKIKIGSKSKRFG